MGGGLGGFFGGVLLRVLLAFLAGFLAAVLRFFCGGLAAILGYDFCQSRQSFNQVNHGSDKNPARKNPACSSKGKRKRIVFAVVDQYV